LNRAGGNICTLGSCRTLEYSRSHFMALPILPTPSQASIYRHAMQALCLPLPL
jgi:hypothetical protein